ncbi:hypothetical protein GGS21DRAFT_379144 [Xylaria nigripes]|nr:hypothetical protein GGS21DRAFT_414707 [Xylaria nigripes]KAI2621548.1 hypothetical protein GGS21DRAFT_379144 [Xylaria nigripes]
MDDTPATESPLSAKERFRRFREGHFNKPSMAGSASTTTSSPTLLDDVSHVAANIRPQVEIHADSGKTSSVDASTLLVSPTLLQESGATRTQSDSYFETAQARIHPDSPQTCTLADNAPMVSFHPPHIEQPATLDPSTLALSIESDAVDSPSVPTDDGLDSGQPLPSSIDSTEAETHTGYSQSLLSHVPTGPLEYLITLPFQPSSRTQYNDIIRENEALMIEYNASFRVVPHGVPRKDLIEKLDAMFCRLFDICDFPPFLDSLTSMSPEQITKHVIGTNAKFSFVAELLDDLQSLKSNKKILILVRPGKLMELLGHVIQSRGCRYIRSDQEVSGASDAEHLITVALSSTSDEKSSLTSNFDVVIAFDYTFRQELISSSNESRSPIILALVNTASIQHLNICIVEDLQPLDRKMVLILALVKAMRLVEDPDPSASLFSIAEKFSRRIQMPEGGDDDFYWEAQSLPTEIFDDLGLASSQVVTTQLGAPSQGTDLHSGSQKRSHVDDDGDESLSKRPKMIQPQVISSSSHISDALRRLLGDDLTEKSDNATVVVPLNKLQALSAKFSELESKLEKSMAREKEFRQLSNRIQEENNSYVSSIQNIQTRYMDALKERGIFETDCQIAQEQASVLSSSLDSSRTEIAMLKTTQAELEKKLAEANDALVKSSNPNHGKMVDLERNLSIANKQVQRLEKRIVVAQSDVDYSKNLYTQISRRAAELSAENRGHEKRIQELQRQASSNVLEVNKVQSRNEVRVLAQQLKEQKNIVREREAELSRIKEELRAIKNGRRETRQSSVPRSPRPNSLGVMSPRNGTRGSSAVGGGPSGSRGTSPQPSMAVFDAQVGLGNGVSGTALFSQGSVANRFAHLRDQRF